MAVEPAPVSAYRVGQNVEVNAFGRWRPGRVVKLGAEHDLNRLHREARWDAALGRWVRIDT